MSVTLKQLEEFTGTTAPAPIQDVMANINPAVVLPVGVQDQMNRSFWDAHKVDKVRQDMHSVIGVGQVKPPTEFEQQNALNAWWKKSGQFLPRFVLDEVGIVGGEVAPTIKESMELQNTQQLTAVKDHLIISRDNKQDPLSGLVNMPVEEQQTDDKGQVIRNATPDDDRMQVIKDTNIEDLRFIASTMSSNLLDPDFDEATRKAVDEEIKIKETMALITDNMEDIPLLALVGVDLANTFFLNLPEFSSRKGFNPGELFDPKEEQGSRSIIFRAASRIREQLTQEEPSLIKKIGINSGGVAAQMIQFMLLPNPAKLTVFSKLPKLVKAGLGIGSKGALQTILKAPTKGETLVERAKETAIAGVSGVIAGVAFSILGSAFTKLGDKAFKVKFPQFKDYPPERIALLKKATKSWNKIKTQADLDAWKSEFGSFTEAIANDIKVIKKPVFRVTPKGKFRGGHAEIEKPAQLAAKVTKQVARTKEAAAIAAAKVTMAVKTQPSRAAKPTRVITREQMAGLKEVGAIGEGEKVRIVANPQLKKSIQADENKIAELKTRVTQLKAEKQFVKAKTLAQQIAKKEIALADLKARSEIKLETTVEGFETKIDRIKTATAFKEELRNDAISMVTAIDAGIRKDFIKRANSVKTVHGLQKLTEQVEKKVKQFKHKAAITELDKTIGKIEETIDELPSPQRERLIEAIDSVSTKKISKQKLDPLDLPRDPGDLDVRARKNRKQLLGDDLVSLQRTTQRLASQLAGQLESLEPEVEEALRIPNERVRQLNLIAVKNANELDLDDIKFITESMQNTFHEAKLKGKLLVARGFKPLEGTLENAPAEIRSTKKAVKQTKAIVEGKGIKTKKGGIEKKVEGAKRIVRLDRLHADTLIELMTGAEAPNTTLILDTNPHKALRDNAELFNAWRKVVSNRFENVGFDDLDQILTEHTVTLAGVTGTDVTLSELMTIELFVRDADNLAALLDTDGLKVGDKLLLYPKDRAGNVLVDRLKELQDATAIVRDSKLAMDLLEITEGMNRVQRPAVNEASNFLFGHDTARGADTHSSRPRVGDQRVSGAKGEISTPPEKTGRYLQRTGGVKPIRIDPWHTKFLQALESDSAMSTMSVALRNARVMLANKAFVDSAKAAGREAELKNLITIFARAQAVTTSKDIVDVYAGRLLAARATSALGFRISTRGTQILSAFAAQAITGNQGMVAILPYGKDAITKIEEDSSIMSLRWVSRRVGIEVGNNASDDAFSLLFHGKTKGLKNKGMTGLIKGDKQAIANIYYQLVVPELLNTARSGRAINVRTFEGRTDVVERLPKWTKADVDTDAFRYAAARRLEYVVRRSQPMFDMLDRPVALSSTSLFRRSFNMFQTALNAMDNLNSSTLIQLQKGLISRARATQKVGSVAASLAAVAIWKNGLKWAINTGVTAVLAAFGVFQFRDKKEAKEVAEKLGTDFLKGVASLTPETKVLATVAELAANKMSGSNYPWGREPVENPIIEVMNSGGDVGIDLGQFMFDTTMLKEIVEEENQGDIDHNDKVMQDSVDSFVDLFKSSWNFGTTILGSPVQAPAQEFIKPFFDQSDIAIIREVTFGDVDNPQAFSQSVHDLFEKKADLKQKEKKTRLSRDEERILARLDNFTKKMNGAAEIMKQTQQHEIRKSRFSSLQTFISTTENSIKLLESMEK